MVKEQTKQKKDISMWTTIVVVIAVVYILSLILPSGSYQRTETGTAIPGSYEVVEKIYLSPLDVVMKVCDQAYNTFGKLFICLMIMSGLMGVTNSTGVLDKALANMIRKFKDKALLIIPVYVFATGVLGAMGSMISTVVLFVPLGLSLAKQLRADRSFAVGLVICGSFTAFMSSPINMLTCIMGQTIAGIPEYSGGGLRTIVTIVNLIIVSAFLILWVKRCQKDPSIYEKNFGGAEIGDGMDNVQEYSPLTGREIIILILFFGTFIFFAAGGVLLNLSMLPLASVVLPLVLVIGFLGGYDLDETMKHWAKGTGGMASVMLFMIFACYMNVILNNSGILDTLVYYVSMPLSYLSGALAVVGMFIANAVINVFINSGSGQTAIMMPIMAPLADVLGVTRQMSVLALQYGDGFTNLLAPTSVNLMACLAAAKIGLKDWYKLCVPLYALLAIVLIISIFVGTAIGYS
ncbi:Na+/H+ antiporter NhaC family protein [Pseudoflavonifractor sp. 60]|uniref:Na+/H+ antiporter NhaC family protein n=1 Tax=Pseudoflavonifractor sp. 60 TaxID=2304576 RepID=UPI0013719783|nr:Na+/H+ antiporter NhaC family protein [Pseudoflavonifractor sp. 60]